MNYNKNICVVEKIGPKISITEVQAETQEKLDDVQINIAGRIELVNN